jgi:hypothetical protein
LKEIKIMPGPKKTSGFRTYRVKASPTIEAMQSDSAFQLDGQNFAEGDFIVKAEGGKLVGKSQEEFNNEYELVRATWSRKKKGEGETESTSTEASTGEAQASTEAAA